MMLLKREIGVYIKREIEIERGNGGDLAKERDSSKDKDRERELPSV